ncbi:hypothetical protein WOLCODRAFT_74112 [Wolfiporia cocos MD-104 SS10]|uniref:BTB domain-containing protein n=1 Tax=Wolfiporia cocos (strain MD-104) TaxID=742152 RepID=A0A2H3JLL1_WOLCO|nr:hypothetical protein WOLCODRAFT_74112 [Wolfiporia cocos MD-104 SS10]
MIADDTKSDEVTPDDVFWLDDGNVILLVGRSAFRVHKSMLARYSEIFTDMFATPQPPDAEQLYGCPVVHLADDEADLRHILWAIYDGGKYLVNQTVSFDIVAAHVRLGHKYQMGEIYTAALRRMHSCFTNNLVTWLTVEKEYKSAEMSFEPIDAITAVNLARLTKEHSMLPTALFICSQLPPDMLVRGVQRPDGSWEQLSPDDLARCIEGRTRLFGRRLFSSVRIGLPHLIGKELRYPSEDFYRHCRDTNMPLKPDMIPTASRTLSTPTPTWCCERCMWIMRDEEITQRNELWKDLPEIMGLASPDVAFPWHFSWWDCLNKSQ